MARAIPVLPLVGSTTVVPAVSKPACSAASIIDTAMRSFTLPAGLKNSSLAATRAPAPSVTCRRPTSGVPPMSWVMSSAMRMSGPFRLHRSTVDRSLRYVTQRIGFSWSRNWAGHGGPHRSPVLDGEVVEDDLEMRRFRDLHVVLPQQDLRRGHAELPGRCLGVVLANPHGLVELFAQRLWHHSFARPPRLVIRAPAGGDRPHDSASPAPSWIPLLRGTGTVSDG